MTANGGLGFYIWLAGEAARPLFPSVTPLNPICNQFCVSAWKTNKFAPTSWRMLYQSTQTLLEILASCIVTHWGESIAQWYVLNSRFWRVKLELSKNEPARIEDVVRQFCRKNTGQHVITATFVRVEKTKNYSLNLLKITCEYCSLLMKTALTIS